MTILLVHILGRPSAWLAWVKKVWFDVMIFSEHEDDRIHGRGLTERRKPSRIKKEFMPKMMVCTTAPVFLLAVSLLGQELRGHLVDGPGATLLAIRPERKPRTYSGCSKTKTCIRVGVSGTTWRSGLWGECAIENKRKHTCTHGVDLEPSCVADSRMRARCNSPQQITNIARLLVGQEQVITRGHSTTVDRRHGRTQCWSWP